MDTIASKVNLNDKARITKWLHRTHYDWLIRERSRIPGTAIKEAPKRCSGYLSTEHTVYALFYKNGYFDTVPGDNTHIMWVNN